MAVRYIYRLISPLSDNRLPFIIPNRLLCLSYPNGATHPYRADRYHIEKEKLNAFIEHNPLRDIRRRSGAVVRFEIPSVKKASTKDEGQSTKDEGQSIKDEGQNQVTEPKSRLLVVGSPNQIRQATHLLNEALGIHQEMTQEGKVEEGNLEEDWQGSGEDKPMWHGYRRNFKGQRAPVKGRKACIRRHGKRKLKRPRLDNGQWRGNPCALCQMILDYRYYIHYTDIEVLNHFICPHSWNIIDRYVTGTCRDQQKKLVEAINKARMEGFLPFTVMLPRDPSDIQPKLHVCWYAN